MLKENRFSPKIGIAFPFVLANIIVFFIKHLKRFVKTKKRFFSFYGTIKVAGGVL